MKRRYPGLALLTTLIVAGCMPTRPEQSTRMLNGKPVYTTTCNVDQSTLGQKAIWGPNRGQRITPENSCLRVQTTCPNGHSVIDLQQGVPEYQVTTMDTGTQRITRRFYTRLTSVTYQCRG